MVTDTIADALTRIRNAQRAKFKVVKIPSSRMVKSLLSVLSGEGFIGEVVEAVEEKTGFSVLTAELRYFPDGRPVIGECTRVSKPGRRMYSKVGELKPLRSGLGVSIISTPKGVMSDRQARKLGVGGEVLAIVS